MYIISCIVFFKKEVNNFLGCYFSSQALLGNITAAVKKSSNAKHLDTTLLQ
jgi:hypothetical protein